MEFLKKIYEWYKEAVKDSDIRNETDEEWLDRQW